MRKIGGRATKEICQLASLGCHFTENTLEIKLVEYRVASRRGSFSISKKKVGLIVIFSRR